MKITEEQHFGGPYYNFQGATIQKLVINSNVNKKGKKRHQNKRAQKPKQEHTDEEKEVRKISREELVGAILSVQDMFWGNSSYAVIFCSVRDHYNGDDNYTLFEEEVSELSVEKGLQYPCPPNTIASAFYYNRYLKLNVGKWKENNVKQRSILLDQAFTEAVEKIRRQQKF